MTSSVETADAGALAGEIGSRLLGMPIVGVRIARPGRNNRVFRLTTVGGDSFAIKFYQAHTKDLRDRLGQEYEALSFLAQQGVPCVPRPFGCDPTQRCALYEWIDGEPPPNGVSSCLEDVDALADFLILLQEYRPSPQAALLRQASASVFSAEAAIAQFRERLARLREVAGLHQELSNFLGHDLEPAAARAIEALLDGFSKAGIGPDSELSAEQRVLSPSDFGLHNALRTERGLFFFDFEYFGWDDPVKLACDVVLHPGSSLPQPLAQHLTGRLSEFFTRLDRSFAIRHDLLCPVFGTIWCLILLNDFLPERWSQRMAAHRCVDRSAAQFNQLTKARHFLDLLRRNYADLISR